MLIQAGADVNACDQLGDTPITAASYHGHDKVVQSLIQAGASINANGLYDKTPLIEASSGGHCEIVQMLIQAGANIDLKGKTSGPPLYSASSNGHDKVVQILILAGANLDARGLTSFTPLMVASRNGHDKIVQMLIQAGADINAKDASLHTALILAKSEGHDHIVAILKEAGAKGIAVSQRSISFFSSFVWWVCLIFSVWILAPKNNRLQIYFVIGYTIPFFGLDILAELFHGSIYVISFVFLFLAVKGKTEGLLHWSWSRSLTLMGMALVSRVIALFVTNELLFLLY